MAGSDNQEGHTIAGLAVCPHPGFRPLTARMSTIAQRPGLNLLRPVLLTIPPATPLARPPHRLRHPPAHRLLVLRYFLRIRRARKQALPTSDRSHSRCSERPVLHPRLSLRVSLRVKIIFAMQPNASPSPSVPDPHPIRERRTACAHRTCLSRH